MTGCCPAIAASFGKSCSTTLRARAFASSFSCRWRASLSLIVGRRLLDIDARVPDVQHRHLGEFRHALAIRANAGQRGISRRPSLKPLLRHARTTLAARRLTSHSQGAGRVSSRSLMSKMTRRSGVAKSPKLSRWQSPHAWTRRPVAGVPRQVGRHVERRPAIEGERRAHHAAVANGDQLGKAPLVRLLQQPKRIRAILRRLPDRVRLRGHLSRRRLPIA